MDHWKAIELASHFVLIEQSERALKYLEHASPELAESWLWRSNALHQLARYDDAVEAAQHGLAIDADSSSLHHALARAEFMLRHLVKAEEAIVESLRLNPEEPEALAMYAAVLSSLGKRHPAEEVARRASERAPESRSVRLTQAVVTWQSDDETAVRISRELLEAEPDGAAEHWWHGMNLVRRGRLRDAKVHFARAAALEPANGAFRAAARVSSHWFFWPLRVTSPILYWLAFYSILPLLMLAADFGGYLWPAMWFCVAWSTYALVHLIAHRIAGK